MTGNPSASIRREDPDVPWPVGLSDGKYSLPPEKSQLAKKEDIQEAMFPPPGDLPTIGDLLRNRARSHRDRENSQAPPTKEFPDLDASSWESGNPTLRRVGTGSGRGSGSTVEMAHTS